MISNENANRMQVSDHNVIWILNESSKMKRVYSIGEMDSTEYYEILKYQPNNYY